MSLRLHETAHSLLRVAAVFCVLWIWSISPASARTPGQVPDQITFWVSPQGDDHADGSHLHPFRTLFHARDVVRAARSQNGLAKYAVMLLGGTYRLSHRLALDWRDSGRAGADIVWSAAPGAHPIVSGAFQVQHWSVHDSRLHIFEARVPKGVSTRQLYVNGWRATRAKGPMYPVGFVRTADGFLAPDTSLDSWRNPRDLEAVTQTQWKMMRCPVASIQGRAIVMQQPCWKNVNVFPSLWSFQTLTWLENAYELLNASGEWYLDSPAGRLYYIPLRGQQLNRADVELPVDDVLIDVRGTLRRPVTHIRFQGLTFAYATWRAPGGPNGYAVDQSGFHLNGYGHQSNLTGHDPNTVRTPGNIRLAFDRYVTFAHDDFLHLGGVGLDFDTGSEHNTVVGNRFRDISSSAIELGGVSAVDARPSHPGQATIDNLVSNNLIAHVGREYTDAAGIFVGFTTHSQVSHNDISYVPWSAIAIGWGWGLLDPGGFPGVPGAVEGQWGTYTTPTASRRNVIADNRIHDFLDVLWDGGAIYSLGQQGASARDGELIAGNVAFNKRRLAGGNVFYTDGGSRYVTIERNVSVNNIPGVTDFGPCGLPDSLAVCAFRLPYGSDRGGCRPYGDLTYRQNYWQFPTPYFEACPYAPYPLNVTDTDNHVITGWSQVPGEILGSAGLQPAYQRSVGATNGGSKAGP